MNFKRIVLVSLVLGLIGAAIGLYMYNKPHKNYEKAKPEFVLNATALIQEFEKNEISANEKYLNKMIQVRGEVVGVSKSETGEVSIALVDDMFGVTCTLDATQASKQKDRLDNVKTGQQVSLKGRCDGMLTDVRLSKATLIVK